jgi:hypothetical protein
MIEELRDMNVMKLAGFTLEEEVNKSSTLRVLIVFFGIKVDSLADTTTLK